MWWMLEVVRKQTAAEVRRRPVVDTIWCRSKEEADDFLSRTGAKLVRVARVERRCGKRVDDPPADVDPPGEQKRPPSAREALELAEEWYFDPEVEVDEWEEI